MVIAVCKRGDLYIVVLESVKDSHVQKGIRPVMVVSSDINNKFSATVNVVPLTATIKKLNQPTHIVITGYGLAKKSMTLIENIITIDKDRLTPFNYIGRITDEKLLDDINKAIINQLT